MDPWFVVLGLLVGTLVGMTGVGAGSLVTPALALSGIPPAIAVGTDLAYAAVSKSFGALVHGMQRTLDLRVAGTLAAGSVPAAALTIGLLAATGSHDKSALITRLTTSLCAGLSVRCPHFTAVLSTALSTS